MKSLAYFLLFVLAQLAAAATVKILSTDGAIAPVPTLLTLMAYELVLGAGLWWWLRLMRRRERLRGATGSFERSRPAAAPAPLGTRFRSLGARIVFACFATILAAFGLSLLLEPLGLSDGGTTAFFSAVKDNPLCIIGLCIIGPACEEIFFRAGITADMARRLPGWAAAAVGALAFACIHGNLAQGIPAFLIGWVLGLMYLRTGDLRLCLPAHIANNTFAVVMMHFPHMLDFTHRWTPLAVVALALLHLGLCVLNVWRTVRR